jgi:exopolyphosphatase / guanosine-5'-triphosphate,3'-diphosphate pyrophosphatase
VNVVGHKVGHPARRRRTEKGRGRRRRQSDPVIAALDLGTNNCRLLIARVKGNGFRVIDGFSRIVRLGEGLEASGQLSEAAMDRTRDALKICAEKIRKRSVLSGRYIATEACRRAENGEAFLKQIESETGLSLEAIPSREEAELTLAGCLPLLDPSVPYALTFDVGGGSAEILWVRLRKTEAPEIIGWISLPCGVVTMTERYGTPEFSAEDYRAMVADIEAQLRPFDEIHGISAAMARGEAQMLGTAGTVTTIAGVNMGLPRYNRSMVDGTWLEFGALHSISKMLVGSSFAERAAHACIGQGRAELVVAGCGVLEAVCTIWPAGRLRVADRGVREGILLALSKAVSRSPGSQATQ